MDLNKTYQEKVYAGVLGKVIGVYLGRPFEQWSHQLIMEKLGPIQYYVSKKLNKPLIVTDDDITGTFTFLRALKDYGYNYDISSEKIGQTWLNYIIEKETILWWGGVGNSTEHTAFQNLKNGISAPQSGSIETNGSLIAEQIGAQIFIDGWAMVCPGDPEKASNLAARAAKVSHDGEAVYGAQVIASIEALAFVESDIDKLINTAKGLIPNNSNIYKLINDVQDWHYKDRDWLISREKIEAKYGYDKYPGECHIVPNHALIILGLLYGDGDFQKSMMIVNTSGWDTDCNAGNLGCIIGIRNGLKAFEGGQKWREPVNDIMYCPTANGGETITDAVRESYKIINIAKKLQGQNELKPKNSARYHFEMPGSVQGWLTKNKDQIKLTNVNEYSDLGERSLKIEFNNLTNKSDNEIFVSTFFPDELRELKGEAKKTFFYYNFLCCPIVYSGQVIEAFISGDPNNKVPVKLKLFVKTYGENDKLETYFSDLKVLNSNEKMKLEWKLMIKNCDPIVQIGIKIFPEDYISGKLYLDYLKIKGNPKTVFRRPDHVPIFERGKVYDISPAEMWRNSWVKATDHWENRFKQSFRITNNKKRGMIITGTSEWKDYTVSSKLNFFLAESGGIAARVQGLERYYGLELTRFKKLRLIKMLDGLKILKEVDFDFEFNKNFLFSLSVKNNIISGKVNEKFKIDYTDMSDPLDCGGIGLVVESGTLFTNEIIVN